MRASRARRCCSETCRGGARGARLRSSGSANPIVTSWPCARMTAPARSGIPSIDTRAFPPMNPRPRGSGQRPCEGSYGYGGDVADMAVALRSPRTRRGRARPPGKAPRGGGAAARCRRATRYGAQHRGDARPHEVQLVDRTGLGGRVGAQERQQGSRRARPRSYRQTAIACSTGSRSGYGRHPCR